MPAPQQKPRQREEHRDREIEATEQPTVDATRVPGLECNVGDNDADGRACPHSFHGGQKAASSPHIVGGAHDDSLPVIGRSPVVPNALFAFGHGFFGLIGAATTGQIVADLVTGRAPPIDLAPYRINRF